MGRIASWWRGMSTRGKAITIGVVIALLVVGSVSSRNDDQGSSIAEATATPGRGTPNEEPTDEPTPDATREPTASPTPRETAEPTPVPTPTTVPTPTPAPTPAFADIALSGVGDAVPRFELPANMPAIADITHTGGSNFAVITIAEDGSSNDLLVNTIGAYTGSVLFDESDQRSVAFEVTAGGTWTITLKPLTAAFAWDGVSDLSGTGDDVVRIDPRISGLVSAQVTHSGESNFAILAYDSGGQDLLVNEIGPYSGEVLIGSGTFFLEILADGAWTVSPS